MTGDTFEYEKSKNGFHPETTERDPLLDKPCKRFQFKEPPMSRKAAVMICGLIQQFVSVGLGMGLSVMYAELISVFDAQRSYAALIQGLYLGVTTGAGILFTRPIRKYGPGPCTVVGAVLCCVGLFASAFAKNIVTIILCVGVISGAGMCFCYLSGFIVISWIFHKDPGLPLVFLTVGSSVGQFVIPALYETFISMFSWSGAFMIMSGLALQCIPFGFIIYCSRDYYVTGNEDDATETDARLSTCDTTLFTDFLIGILVITSLFFALSGNTEVWFIVDVVMSRGYDRQSGSVLVSAIGFANFIGRLAGTLMKFKCKTVPTITHWIYICPFMAVVHTLVVNLDDYYALAAASTFQGMLCGICVSQGPTIMYEAAGHQRYPQGMALINLMYGFGNLFSNVFGGIIRDQLGVYDVAFYVSTGLSICMTSGAVIATFIIRRRNKKELDTPMSYAIKTNIKYTTLD